MSVPSTNTNPTTPSTGSSGSGTTPKPTAAKPTIGLTSNQFLTLLATQLKNQNPLNPTDPNQFTSQMVQYANLSEQIDSNQSLGTMSTTMSSILTQVSQLASTLAPATKSSS